MDTTGSGKSPEGMPHDRYIHQNFKVWTAGDNRML